MQKIMLALVLICAVVNLSSCHRVVGEGPTITQNRSTADFSTVEMAVPGEMYYTPGNQFKIEITAQQNILDIIETVVSNGELRVRVKNSVNIKSNEPIVVKVTAPDVSALGVNGSGNIKVLEDYNPASTTISINGSGNMLIANLRTNSVRGKISGSGKIEVLNGNAETEDLSISGSGLIDMAGLMARDSKTSTSGSGTMRVNVQSTLDCRISGSGVVMYKGSPKVSSSISGSGRVVPI
jgi:putative autotransporter adhesin-like protein